MGLSIPLSRVQARGRSIDSLSQNTKSLICSVSHVRAHVHRQGYDNLRHPLRCTGVLSHLLLSRSQTAFFRFYLWWRKRGSGNETTFVISLLSFSTFHHLAPACEFSLELLTFQWLSHCNSS